MRQLSYSIVCLILCCILPVCALAQPNELDQAAFYTRANDYLQTHLAHHSQGGDGENFYEMNLAPLLDKETRCVFPVQAAESILNCMLFSQAFPMEVPRDATGVLEILEEVIQTAYFVSESLEEAMPMDHAATSALTDEGGITWAVGEENLWTLYEGTPQPEIMVPFVIFSPESGKVIDNYVYLLVVNSTETTSQIWIFADQEIVRNYVARIPLDPDKGVLNSYLLAWLSTPPAEASAPAQATPAPDAALAASPIGQVTGKSSDGVFIRAGASQDFPSIGVMAPGQAYDALRLTESNWYEISLPDGTTGYVSARMVTFTEASAAE